MTKFLKWEDTIEGQEYLIFEDKKYYDQGMRSNGWIKIPNSNGSSSITDCFERYRFIPMPSQDYDDYKKYIWNGGAYFQDYSLGIREEAYVEKDWVLKYPEKARMLVDWIDSLT